jgi:molybdopterin-dependent oxidoreductase alpha subunit
MDNHGTPLNGPQADPPAESSPADRPPEQVRAQPPETVAGLSTSRRATSAAGIPSVVSSMWHVWREMGIVRGVRALLRLNQPGGIDCMSCAWADPDEGRHMVEFCENGAKAVAWEGDTDRVTPEFFRQWSVAELSRQSDYWLGQQGRLVQPLLLRSGEAHYEPIAWDEAFRLIAAELRGLASPDEAIFYTSGRTSNEAAFLYQLFVRQFGTNNLPDCSNMCHESSGAALAPTIGIGKGTVKLDDFDRAQVIVILGQNPGTNHPRMLLALQRAKRKGCKIIAINPLPEAGLMRFKNPQEVAGLLGAGTQLADLFLPVRINGDAALLKGLMKLLLEAEDRRSGAALDGDFIREKTVGFEALAADVRAADWQRLTEDSGISREQMEEAAGLLMRSERIIACWAMGLTQHTDAVATIQQIVNLLLMRGSIGKPGAGVCPVRGHSNVQGDRTMGIWERPPEAFLNKLQEVFRFDPPRRFGYDSVEAIHAMHQGKAKFFFALGGNFLSAAPDTEYTADALRQCQMTVQVSTKLNRSHLVTGRTAIILPCLGRTERDLQGGRPQFVSCENSMGVVQSSQGSFPPSSGDLLSEPAIVARLARAVLGSRSQAPWESLVEDYDRIRDLIERVIPGFEDYNQRVRKSGGFYLPNLPRQGVFPTKSSKAQFTVHALPDNGLEPGQLVMTTIRSHDQFNTTVYGLEDRYRGIHNGRRVILMNAADIRELGLAAGQVVDLTSYFQGRSRVARQFVVVPYDIPRRCAAGYFPETNVLVPIESVARMSNTPTSKYVVIRVTPAIPAKTPKPSSG